MGDAVVTTRILDGDRERTCAALAELPGPLLAGVDAPVVTAEEKAALRNRTGAAAVDMESHKLARAAERLGVPFVAWRVVSDEAGTSLPRAAVAGFSNSGEPNIGAVLAALARRPFELPALIRTGRDAARAHRTLRAFRKDQRANYLVR